MKSLKSYLKLPFFALFILLGGCNVVLYTDISENDANEMLVLLLENGISASKADGSKSPMKNLMVQSSQIAQALDILQSQGFPKQVYSDLGTLFAKQGLISSPTEEKVRFIYGVSQQLAETISQIDGVIVARVNVVIPDTNVSSQTTEPSSASVLIKYNRAYELDSQIPQIKLLVANSVEGLTYEKVTVVLFPALDAKYGKSAESYQPTSSKSMGMHFGDIKNIMSTLIATLLVVGALLFVFLQATRKKTINNAEDDFYDPKQ